MSNPYLDVLSGRRGSAFKVAASSNQCQMNVSAKDYVSGTKEVPGAPRVRAKSGANISPTVAAFLSKLSAVWPLPDVPIVVSRAKATPASQAAAMLSNFKSEGGGPPGDYPYDRSKLSSYPSGVRYLYGLYGNKEVIYRLLRAPQDSASWGSILQGFINKGIYVSSHLRDDAVDLRCWNMTRAGQEQVARTIESSFPGSKVVIEKDHLHVEALSKVEGGQTVSVPSIPELPSETPEVLAKPSADALAWWSSFWNPKRDAIAKVLKADPEIVSDTLKWAVPTTATVILLGVGLSRIRRRGSFAHPESP
jgi:hypothetical protein